MGKIKNYIQNLYLYHKKEIAVHYYEERKEERWRNDHDTEALDLNPTPLQPTANPLNC
jgi:hypothetical protein